MERREGRERRECELNKLLENVNNSETKLKSYTCLFSETTHNPT